MTTNSENIKLKVDRVLDKLRHYLQIDGGDIEFVLYEEETQTAEFRFLGNCRECPLNMMTLRAGIERFILKEIPEIRRIEKVE